MVAWTIYLFGVPLTYFALSRGLGAIRKRAALASLLWPIVWPLAILVYAVKGSEWVERERKRSENNSK